MEIGRSQHGVLTRKQALDSLTPGAIRARLDSGRWQNLGYGIYATFTGPLPRQATLWAAVLRCGERAVLSHQTAAEVHGLIDERAAAIHVTIPSHRRAVAIPGIVVHRSAHLARARHPTRRLPVTRLEETVLDLAETASALDEAIAFMSAAIGRRLTIADRMRTAMGRRSRVRWRRDLLAALADIDAGCHSLLELRYLRDVERAHALAVGHRQAPARQQPRPQPLAAWAPPAAQSTGPQPSGPHPSEAQVLTAQPSGAPPLALTRNAGARLYRDVRYDEFATVVELDGRVAHPPESRGHDMRRDNVEGRIGGTVLHYGWNAITRAPCVVAAEVASALHARGWPGTPRRCGPNCGAFS